MSGAGPAGRLHESGPVDDRPDLGKDELTVVIGDLAFAGIGWRATADALLARASAAKARDHRQTVRQELTTRNHLEKG